MKMSGKCVLVAATVVVVLTTTTAFAEGEISAPSHSRHGEETIYHRNRGIGLQQFDTATAIPAWEVKDITPSPVDASIPDNGGMDELGEEGVGLRALENAIKWVKSKMDREWGWGMDTPHTLLALSLADPDGFANNTLKSQLMIKEFQIQLVLRLWRERESSISAGQLALNVMVLLALCQDPRNFYSKDLIGLLEHRDPQVDFENAFSLLASCSAGRHIRKSKIRKLLDTIHDHSRIHSIDTLAVSILVLQCSQKQRRKDMRKYISDSVTTLLERQYSDGSFASNLHSTAISLQALSATGYGRSWNATTAFQYVMSHQLPDGSFGNLFDTNAVLPLLKGKTLMDVAERNCFFDASFYEPEGLDKEKTMKNDMDRGSQNPVASNEIPSTPTMKPKEVEMINMTYIIWVGNDATLRYNLTFTVPENTTFLEIMKMAAEENENFEFSASKWANGYYIHTLAGQQEKQVGYWFWLLYKLSEPPVPGTKPDNKFVVAQGVQELMPQDGDYILFWYHKI